MEKYFNLLTIAKDSKCILGSISQPLFEVFPWKTFISGAI